MKLVRETHGGKVYDSDFSQRMRGSGIYAEMTKARFNVACKRVGIVRNAASGFRQRQNLFKRPIGTFEQSALFD